MVQKAGPMIVAIDGPAGAGKSTVAKNVAAELGFVYINSGNLYRAITLSVFQAGIDPKHEAEVSDLADSADVSVDADGTKIDGRLVDGELRTARVDAAVAPVSSFPRVRNAVNQLLVSLARTRDAVVEGRDMGTVVFPDAEVKIYMDASIDSRALRRYKEAGDGRSLEEIREAIEKRDRIDQKKAGAPLRPAEDALYLDTSRLTIEAVCEKVVQICTHHIQREIHNKHE